MLAQRRLRRDLETLQHDINKLQDDFKDVAEPKHGHGEATDGRLEQIQWIVTQAQETLLKVREQMKETGTKVGEKIEEHPLASVCAAIGVGFLLAKFINLGRR